ncbi:sal-like protein 3 [Corchorus olitorius]|uniref:Sal-like protein 3 n=1 Tax=Corchorus olitorius TaxID=93759 RepID=A0A1R3GGY3_9ROSI|nr:sal-like protein 3 [Corchorus olitorius]
MARIAGFRPQSILRHVIFSTNNPPPKGINSELNLQGHFKNGSEVEGTSETEAVFGEDCCNDDDSKDVEGSKIF